MLSLLALRLPLPALGEENLAGASPQALPQRGTYHASNLGLPSFNKKLALVTTTALPGLRKLPTESKMNRVVGVSTPPVNPSRRLCGVCSHTYTVSAIIVRGTRNLA